MINSYTPDNSHGKNRCQAGVLVSLLLMVFLLPPAYAELRGQAPANAQPTTTQLEQAIQKLAARSGPPGAYRNNLTKLNQLSLIQTSLWQRLRNQFEFTHLEHPTIQLQIEFMQEGLHSLVSNLYDGTPYLFFIVEEIERAGLPMDIALLPLVESAFDPLAKSSQHAVGLWQFIPSTADDFGLVRNQWYDGRNDVVASTKAAVRYLKRLQKSFDGDWLLALAAYNTGPGNVRHAMRKAQKNGLEPTFWNLKLARETRDYVPRLLAVNKMISDPKAYGLSLPSLPNHKIIDTISVGRPLTLAKAARLADVPVDQMLSLNTGYLDNRIPLGGPYHLTVPAGKSRQLLDELSKRKLNLAASESSNNDTSTEHPKRLGPPKGAIVPLSANTTNLRLTPDFKPFKKYVYESHIVKSGDNLWDISKDMKTSVETLKQWNGKSPESKKLQPGDKMIVAYVDEETPTDIEQKLINYRVTASDTLFTITDRFNISISALKKWNPALWQKNHIQAGQAIKIPIQTSARPGTEEIPSCIEILTSC